MIGYWNTTLESWYSMDNDSTVPWVWLAENEWICGDLGDEGCATLNEVELIALGVLGRETEKLW